MAFKLKSGSRPAFKNIGSTPAKNMTTGSYSQSFESPAKQRVAKEGEGQDQDKILDSRGNHVGDYVNGKKVMFNDKPAMDKRLSERKDDQRSPYWYKINGKKATRAQYIKYQNKPGGDEPGKQTNDPDASGNKAKIARDRAKLKK